MMRANVIFDPVNVVDSGGRICEYSRVGNPGSVVQRNFFVVDEAAPKRARPQARAETVAKWVLTLAMWGSSYAIFMLGSILAGSSQIFAILAARASMALVGLVVCYGLHRLLRCLAHRPFRTRALAVAAVAPFAAESYAWGQYFAVQYMRGRHAAFTIVSWNDAANVISMWTWFFIAWTGLYLAIEYSFDARYESERSAELSAMAQAAKLRALSNQINPHFLFNSLNSISALILEGRPAEAERMLGRLADFFRSTLSIDPLVDVTLEGEFELHRRYLAIEQLRYPDLIVEVELPAALSGALVPALIVQPLVENAIKHGVAKSHPPTRIVLAAAREGDMLAISIINTANPGIPRAVPVHEGVGTANVRQRLAEYFGDRQSLFLRPAPGRFEARVTMPLAVAA